MPLPMPGNVVPVEKTAGDNTPPLAGGANAQTNEFDPPPLPGAAGAGTVSDAFHSADESVVATQAAAGQEDAEVHVHGDASANAEEPPPIGQAEKPVSTADDARKAMKEAVKEEEQGGLPAIPTSAALPAGVAAGGGDALERLAAAGFEGLKMGFGSFPTVRLINDSFETIEGEKLGQTFACVIQGSRPKFLLKSEDSKESEEFVYSYDRQTTSGGKPISEVKAEWATKGWNKPVWKEYVDVTAQLVDVDKRELGKVVILQVPGTSNDRLTGYMIELSVSGIDPRAMVTQVYPGQKVTSVQHPFHPWAFKKYLLVDQLIK